MREPVDALGLLMSNMEGIGDLKALASWLWDSLTVLEMPGGAAGRERSSVHIAASAARSAVSVLGGASLVRASCKSTTFVFGSAAGGAA